MLDKTFIASTHFQDLVQIQSNLPLDRHTAHVAQVQIFSAHFARAVSAHEDDVSRLFHADVARVTVLQLLQPTVQISRRRLVLFSASDRHPVEINFLLDRHSAREADFAAYAALLAGRPMATRLEDHVGFRFNADLALFPS